MNRNNFQNILQIKIYLLSWNRLNRMSVNIKFQVILFIPKGIYMSSKSCVGSWLIIKQTKISAAPCRWVVSRKQPQSGLRLHAAQLASQRLHVRKQHQPGCQQWRGQRLRYVRRDVRRQCKAERHHDQQEGERRLRLRHHQLTQPVRNGCNQQWV